MKKRNDLKRDVSSCNCAGLYYCITGRQREKSPRLVFRKSLDSFRKGTSFNTCGDLYAIRLKERQRLKFVIIRIDRSRYITYTCDASFFGKADL
jgi:hypothetical protein